MGHAQALASIAYVSRERIIRESEVAQKLGAAEAAITRNLQASVDAVREALDAEEADLARLRAELPPEDFELRATAFDKRIRVVRQRTQERANAVQRSFQEARAAIVAALPPVLEKLRIEAGVEVILNADQILAADDRVDLTARAIEMFNDEGGTIEVPVMDFSTPLLPTAPGTAETQDSQ